MEFPHFLLLAYSQTLITCSCICALLSGLLSLSVFAVDLPITPLVTKGPALQHLGKTRPKPARLQGTRRRPQKPTVKITPPTTSEDPKGSAMLTAEVKTTEGEVKPAKVRPLLPKQKTNENAKSDLDDVGVKNGTSNEEEPKRKEIKMVEDTKTVNTEPEKPDKPEEPVEAKVRVDEERKREGEQVASETDKQKDEAKLEDKVEDSAEPKKEKGDKAVTPTLEEKLEEDKPSSSKPSPSPAPKEDKENKEQLPPSPKPVTPPAASEVKEGESEANQGQEKSGNIASSELDVEAVTQPLGKNEEESGDKDEQKSEKKNNEEIEERKTKVKEPMSQPTEPEIPVEPEVQVVEPPPAKAVEVKDQPLPPVEVKDQPLPPVEDKDHGKANEEVKMPKMSPKKPSPKPRVTEASAASNDWYVHSKHMANSSLDNVICYLQ